MCRLGFIRLRLIEGAGIGDENVGVADDLRGRFFRFVVILRFLGGNFGTKVRV